jgi:peroxiredoxin
MKKYSIAAVLFSGLAGLAVLNSCGNDNSAQLSGHFIGGAGQSVYLERVTPGGATTPQVDTAVMNDKGEFDFKVLFPDGQPTIFNLRYDDDIAPLLISPKEQVSVMSLGALDGYSVSGSPESELVWRLHRILSDGATALDSISRNFPLVSDEEERNRQKSAFAEAYYATKRKHIGFIVENASSLAAVYALYQRLPGDDALFNSESDHLYYRMVADSVSRYYPDSKYVQALRREVEDLSAQKDFVDKLTNEGIPEIDYPDVDLPDMYGKKIKLSSMAGKVIVLDFWSATDSGSGLRNAEMKEMWEAHSEAGLGIYQVSLDTSKPLWITAVQEQKLPWTTVCDFRGEATNAARIWNIDRIPCNFIIDRDGNVVGRNLYGDALESKIKELL